MWIIADESPFYCARTEAWLLVARQVDKGITAPDAQAGKVGSIIAWLFLSFGNFAIVFTLLLPWHKQSLIVQKLLNGSWIQSWWCARNQAMLIYLVMTSLIFAGSSAYCFLLYARRYLAIMLSFRLFCSRLIANFTEDGPRGNVGHAWWTFMRGRLGNVNGMGWVQRSIWSIVENYAIATYLLICLFRWHAHLKDMDSLRGSVYYGRYK